jgi:hypothetical protein
VRGHIEGYEGGNFIVTTHGEALSAVIRLGPDGTFRVETGKNGRHRVVKQNDFEPGELEHPVPQGVDTPPGRASTSGSPRVSRSDVPGFDACSNRAPFASTGGRSSDATRRRRSRPDAASPSRTSPRPMRAARSPKRRSR